MESNPTEFQSGTTSRSAVSSTERYSLGDFAGNTITLKDEEDSAVSNTEDDVDTFTSQYKDDPGSSSSDDSEGSSNVQRQSITPKNFTQLQEANSSGESSENEDDQETIIIQAVTSLAHDLVSRIAEKDVTDPPTPEETPSDVYEPVVPPRRGRGRPRAAPPPPLVITCAHCNMPADTGKGDLSEGRIYFRESLPVMITIRDEDGGRGEKRKREVIVYDALVDIFQLRWKPTQSKLLNVAMESEKDLFVCQNCATRLAHLYEEYNEFTQLAFRTGSFLSPILVGQAEIKTELFDEDGMDIDALAGQNVAAVYDNDFEGVGGFDAYEDSYRNGPMSVQFVHEVGRRKKRGRRKFHPTTKPVAVPSFDGEEISRKRRRNSLKLQCPTCSKEYLNQASYEKHLRLHRRKMRIVVPGEPKRRVGRPRKNPEVDKKPNYKEVDEDDPFVDVNEENSKPEEENVNFLPAWGRRHVGCSECGKKFMSHGHLSQHMKTHTKDRNSCRRCNKTFRYPSELKEHMDSHGRKSSAQNAEESEGNEDEEAGPSIQDDYSDGEPHKASENEDFEAEQQPEEEESVPSEDPNPSDSDEYEPVRRQRRKRRRGRPRTKPISSSSPSTSRLPKKPVQPVTCPECQREFRHPSFLQQHMQVHNKKFMCNQCNQEFQDARGLREHKAEHRREKRANIEPMPCKYCGRQYYDDIRLFRHEETHELPPPNHKCNQCTRTFRRKDTLTSHLATAHTTDCPFECPSCEKKYPRRDKLNRHIARKHGEVKGCEQCGKSFIGEAALKAHQITHFFEKPRELVCHVCGRKYQNLKYLKNHIKFMHTKRNAHACTLCTKTFGRLSCLQKHLIVHQAVGSFLCVHCGKCFKRERSLKQHEQKAHLGESSYENICPICSKRFHRIDLLKAHQVKEGHLEPVPETAPVAGPGPAPPQPPSSPGSPEPRFGIYDHGNRELHHEHVHVHSHSHSTHSSNDSFPHAHSHSHGHGHGHPLGNLHPAHVHHPGGPGDQQMNPVGLPPSLAPDFLFAGLNMNMSGIPYSYDRH